MIIAIPFLVIIGIAAGPLLACLRPEWIRRAAGWVMCTALTIAAHFATTNEEPLWRMVSICCVLLGGMKGLVYAEWAGPGKLSIHRYGVFAFLWFGMDPGSFCSRRKSLVWKNDVSLGLLLMLIGTLSAWLVWAMGWRHIILVFLPLSLGFHFGALRVLKGVVRSAGFPVRTLFPNPLKTHGIADFWSRRWNIGYSQMMQRLIGRPVGNKFGESIGTMAVFIGSGLLHEMAITLPVRSGFGFPTLYFTVHGLLTLVEKKWNRPLGKIPTLLAVLLPLGWLFPPAFRSEIIMRCLGIFDHLSGRF